MVPILPFRILVFIHSYFTVVDHTQSGVEHTQRNVDHPTNINFADFKNVTDAFAALIRVFTEELEDVNFDTIRLICLIRASRKLQNEIDRTANIHQLFALLARNPLCFNWINVKYFQTFADALGNKKLQHVLKNYTETFLSKTLGEIWNSIPSFYKSRTKYYSKVRAKFHGKDPDSITVNDLEKYKPNLAQKIALHIMQIEKGSIMITWCILAEETYEAYLSSLSILEEFRKDDFLQIGSWITYHPQHVIQELKRACSKLHLYCVML